MHKYNYFTAFCLWYLERLKGKLVLLFRTFLCDIFPVTTEALGEKTRLGVALK